MPRKSKVELMTAQAQRLFAQRIYFATHIIIFLAALALTRGRLLRVGVIFIIWVMLLLLHAVYFALNENREAMLRRTYQTMTTDEDPFDEVTHEELDDEQNYYTIGADGELVRIDETPNTKAQGQ